VPSRASFLGPWSEIQSDAGQFSLSIQLRIHQTRFIYNYTMNSLDYATTAYYRDYGTNSRESFEGLFDLILKEIESGQYPVL